MVSSDGLFIYEYWNSIVKINADTSLPVQGIYLDQSSVFNNLAITKDNKYLIYSTGIVTQTDLMNDNNQTTIGIIKTSDMTEATTPFVLSFNDAILNFRHCMIDKILIFDDNQDNTQNTSYEFMMVGSTV